MKSEQFIQFFNPRMSEYCPVVITADGNIFESTAGHIQTLIALSGDDGILATIPKDVSPLMYLAGELHCVVVDYENQLYMDELTTPQELALISLSEAGLIKYKPIRMTSSMLKL